MSQPTINIDRLTLRPFYVRDASVVRELAGERAIADTTMNVPHPYEVGLAESWITSHGQGYNEGRVATFAVVRSHDDTLMGAVSLRIDRDLNKGELGYWIGRPHWNLGYATEAANAALCFGFEDLRLNRIHARHFARNPASGRIMEKIGMRLEGMARQDAIKWGKYEDIVFYGLLREDWMSR
ncbi:GNAT family N-acetyltransferase [Congregibacter brevis]|uniref:GNAT family N-acetyltransferase n=1 Tax=Congregibacter brevis TaxID=3081201 RepID=A0ABZ0IF53_9GAMM|nr:GNAT family N-acetyltransferase [Congregibacter sp. IMCC45268]